MNFFTQVLAANGFAAAMTAAVIFFPSPEAARTAILSALGAEPLVSKVDPTPALNDGRLSDPHEGLLSSLDRANLSAQLLDCMNLIEKGTDTEVEVCGAVVHAFLGEVTGLGPNEPVDAIQEAVLFTSAQICRREWANDTDLNDLDLPCSGLVDS